MVFALAGTLIGAILGLNCSALALIPAIMCVLVIAAATEIVTGGVTVVGLAFLLITLQIGYIGAAGLRFALPRSPARREAIAPSLIGPAPPQGGAH